MAFYIEKPTRSFKTLNEQFTINQEIRRKSNNKAFETQLSISGTNGLSIDTSWSPLISWKNLLDIIISQAPMIKENFPLIETSEQQLGRTLLCSAYLLKDGTLVKVYMPKYYTLRELTGALNRNDKIPLSNGILVHSRDIAAIVNE